MTDQEGNPTDTTLPPVTEENTDPFAEQRAQVVAEARQAALAEAATVYGQAAQDAERRAREAEAKLAERAAAAPAAPTQIDSTEFFSDPQRHTRQIIQEELRSSVGPLNQFMQQTQQQNQYQAIKSQLSMHPQLAPYMGQISNQLDMEAQYLQAVNQQSVAALAFNIIGRAMAGVIPGVALNGGVTQAAPVIPGAPPQVAPSAAVVKKQTGVKIELNEHQRAVARMNKLTDEQYIKWTESDGSITSLREIK